MTTFYEADKLVGTILPDIPSQYWDSARYAEQSLLAHQRGSHCRPGSGA